MSNTTLPAYLYHGSRFEQSELMPGFRRSGKLVRWDNTESNEYLYVTSDKCLAIELGFASSIEKEFRIDRFQVEGKVIYIETPDYLTEKQIEKVKVFLYTIEAEHQDGWVKNNNAHNGIDTEFKTKNTVRNIVECVAVDVKRWLGNYDIVISRILPEDLKGQSKEVMESLPSWVSW